MQVYVAISMDDAFILNCHPTVPVGCEEQVVDAQCTRPYQTLSPSCEGSGPDYNRPRIADRFKSPLQLVDRLKQYSSRRSWTSLACSLSQLPFAQLVALFIACSTSHFLLNRTGTRFRLNGTGRKRHHFYASCIPLPLSHVFKCLYRTRSNYRNGQK